MNHAGARAALNQYKQVSAHSMVEGASPHRLIQMLMDGALEKITLARSFMVENKLGDKAHHITWAISIVDGLRVSLDREKGGEIAQNLEDLYDYMVRRLVLANAQNDPLILDEVKDLLLQIKEAWDAIGPIANQANGPDAA
jgi:flagellar protein FliS